MKTNSNSTESKTDSTVTSPTNDVKPTMPAPPVSEPIEEDVDDFGYGEPAKVEEPKKEEEEAPKVEEEKVEKPATGYGKEETPKVEEPKKEEAPKKEEEPKTEEEKLKKEVSEVFKELPKSFDKEKVSQFALENKFTKEQAEAYVKFAKAEETASEQAQAQALKAQRDSWKDELVRDPEFGGENFDKNVDRAEKVLQKYMSNTKKVLTERGTMLPPYIMRDLLALSKALNPTTTLVIGEGKEEKAESNFLDEMYK